MFLCTPVDLLSFTIYLIESRFQLFGGFGFHFFQAGAQDPVHLPTNGLDLLLGLFLGIGEGFLGAFLRRPQNFPGLAFRLHQAFQGILRR